MAAARRHAIGRVVSGTVLPVPCVVQGFDEFMNLVLDDAEEVDAKKKSRKPLGELRGRRASHVLLVFILGVIC